MLSIAGMTSFHSLSNGFVKISKLALATWTESLVAGIVITGLRSLTTYKVFEPLSIMKSALLKITSAFLSCKPCVDTADGSPITMLSKSEQSR